MRVFTLCYEPLPQNKPVRGESPWVGFGVVVLGDGIDSEQSTLIANEAMRWMAERRLAPTPDNYGLIYAYKAGTDPELTRAIDILVASHTAFDSKALAALRAHRNRSETDEQVMAEVGERVEAELKNLLKALDTAGRDNSAYGQVLSQASGTLGSGNMGGAEISKVVDKMLDATKHMEARSKMLEDRLQTSSREISDLRERLETVRQESLTDQLTGIANRKAFDNEVEQSVLQAQSSGRPLCLMMCDIDHFKKFNDNWGHQTGDQVLRLVANCLAENVKGRDTAARYGGEEFAVILPDTALDSGVILADRIRSNIESKKLIKKSTGDILGTITVSIGMARWMPGESISEFVRRADACLYAAKRGGRNRVISEAAPMDPTAAA